jgi:hypothetical protein
VFTDAIGEWMRCAASQGGHSSAPRSFAGVLRRLNSAVRPRKIRGIGGLLKTALGSACNMKMCGTVILATAYDVTVHIYSQKVTTDYAQE